MCSKRLRFGAMEGFFPSKTKMIIILSNSFRTINSFFTDMVEKLISEYKIALLMQSAD